MKKLLLTLSIIMSVPLIAYATEKNAENEELVRTTLPNPFESFENLKDAESRVGFEIKLPDNIPQGYVATDYRVLITENKMIEIIYKNNNKSICFRKGKLEHISGVYTEFPEIHTVNFGSVAVTFRGKGGKIQLAEWQNNSFSYSIDATEYNETNFSISGGLSKKEMTGMVEAMFDK